MIRCLDCDESAMGYCFAHIPKQEVKEEIKKATFDELAIIVKSFSNHEGTKWVKAPCPHEVIGCNFCGKEYRAHDVGCLVLRAQELSKRI